jgi:P27 family predicted phage terminase small subunit
VGGLNSGRRPKPTALKLIEGNRGHRALPTREFTPREILPPCPDWLMDEAKIEWARVVPELSRVPGLLTVVDMQVLAGYCQSYARWMVREQKITVMGEVYQTTFTSPSGETQTVLKANPLVMMARQDKEAMRRFAAELGFSPSARGRISIPPAIDGPDAVAVES